MSMQLVNGVLCLNCSDVERAKQAGLNGSAEIHDPLHPSAVVPNNNGTAGEAGTSAANASAGATPVAPTDAPVFGINQPLASGNRGTQLNLLT